MLDISVRDSRDALLAKASTIKLISIFLRVWQVIVSFCCCIGLSYSLVNPGYWTNFAVPCTCTYSVAVLSAILDLQQMVLYLQTRTGSTIFKANIPTNQISAFVKSQYGLFLLAQMAALVGWLTAGTILITIPHGKDFRENFNEPPIGAWDLAITSAFLEVIFSFVACFLVHRERELLEIHLKRNLNRTDGLYNIHLSDYPRGSHASIHTRRISSPIGPPVSGVRHEPAPPSSSAGEPQNQLRSGRSERSLHSSRSGPGRSELSGGSVPAHMMASPRAPDGVHPAYANVRVAVSGPVEYDGHWI